MDKRVLRERRRRKQAQLRRRKLIKLCTYVVAAILLVVFLVRGIITPIVHKIGGKDVGESTEVAAMEPETETTDSSESAYRQPLKGQGDLQKVDTLTPGWHEDQNGRWYQNSDGTYYAGGFQEISGVTYYFNSNGYMQTGWVTTSVNDYYFNEDGSYNANKRRPMLALTFDDGPGDYTEDLLNCLEENNAHATFFMLGQNVELYPEVVQHMVKIGCEVGNHSWSHPNMYELSTESVAKQFSDTDNALIKACGQSAAVARCPYGNGNEDIWQAAGKPFFMWSLDTLDWSYRDVQKDYDAVMNGDLTDGTIILMHDIHPESAEAAKRLIPDLVSMGYKLVTVSEMAKAKGVNLQIASYSDFWDSSLAAGLVAGYSGNSGPVISTSQSESSGDEDFSAEDSDEDYSEDDYSEEDYSEEDNSDEDYSGEDDSEEE